MKRKISILIILFLPGILFGQRKYEVFKFGDTAAFHVIYSQSEISGSIDTIYNALKYDITIVKRDISKPIEFKGDTIKQDGKTVGFVFLNDPGPPAYLFSICDPGKNEISKAYSLTGKYYEITTWKDEEKRNLEITNEGYTEEEIVKYLVSHGYL